MFTSEFKPGKVDHWQKVAALALCRKENGLDEGSEDTGRVNRHEDGNGGVKAVAVSCWDSPGARGWNTTSQQEPEKPSRRESINSKRIILAEITY
jgi:hypothetical protein